MQTMDVLGAYALWKISLCPVQIDRLQGRLWSDALRADGLVLFVQTGSHFGIG